MALGKKTGGRKKVSIGAERDPRIGVQKEPLGW